MAHVFHGKLLSSIVAAGLLELSRDPLPLEHPLLRQVVPCLLHSRCGVPAWTPRQGIAEMADNGLAQALAAHKAPSQPCWVQLFVTPEISFCDLACLLQHEASPTPGGLESVTMVGLAEQWARDSCPLCSGATQSLLKGFIILDMLRHKHIAETLTHA